MRGLTRRSDGYRWPADNGILRRFQNAHVVLHCPALDSRAVIYDVKTGQPAASHTAQMQTYMYLVPRARESRWKGTVFEGVVVYRDGDRVKIPASSVNSEFVSKITAFVRKMTSPLPARKVPSLPECGWCDIGKADCDDRLEPDAA